MFQYNQPIFGSKEAERADLERSYSSALQHATELMDENSELKQNQNKLILLLRGLRTAARLESDMTKSKSWEEWVNQINKTLNEVERS